RRLALPPRLLWGWPAHRPRLPGPAIMMIPPALHLARKSSRQSACPIPIIRNTKSITASVRRWWCHRIGNLPAPIATDKPPPPNWSQDPDVKERQAATKSDKPTRPVDPVIEDGRPLRPDELIPKGSANAASSSPGIEPKGGNHLL